MDRLPEVETLDDAQRARRARIVDAAVELLTTTPYEGIQMKDVTARAGVALGTTYRYFASKDHLLAEALLAWAQRFPTAPPDSNGSGGRSVDQLKRAFRTAARAFEPHPSVYGTLHVLQASADPHARRLFNQFGARQETAFASFLPRVPSPRREHIVAVMGAVLDSNLRAWAAGRQPIDQVYENLDVAAELLLR